MSSLPCEFSNACHCAWHDAFHAHVNGVSKYMAIFRQVKAQRRTSIIADMIASCNLHQVHNAGTTIEGCGRESTHLSSAHLSSIVSSKIAWVMFFGSTFSKASSTRSCVFASTLCAGFKSRGLFRLHPGSAVPPKIVPLASWYANSLEENSSSRFGGNQHIPNIGGPVFTQFMRRKCSIVGFDQTNAQQSL